MPCLLAARSEGCVLASETGRIGTREDSLRHRSGAILLPSPGLWYVQWTGNVPADDDDGAEGPAAPVSGRVSGRRTHLHGDSRAACRCSEGGVRAARAERDPPEPPEVPLRTV